MSIRNGLHDRQPQTRATTGARRRRETDERMRQITLREPWSMITNLDRHSVADTRADQGHVAGTMGKRVIHQIAQRILQTLAIRLDGGLVGLHGDRPALELGTTAGPIGHLVEQLAKRD